MMDNVAGISVMKKWMKCWTRSLWTKIGDEGFERKTGTENGF